MSPSDPLDFLDTVDLTEPAARPPKRKPQLLDRISIYLPVLLMGVLALASYWLLRATPGPEAPEPTRPLSSEPDYFMRGFSVKAFDADGLLKSEVVGDEARHHPDDDRIEIDNARIRNMGDEGRPTVASARLVTTNADNTQFILEGDAVVVREGGVGAAGQALPRLEFRGEYLKVFVDPERVVSDQPVTLLRGADRLVADSIDYRGDTGVADFKGRVKVQLLPR
ncbi:MAG: LPS export ABC transporter periplasmic protein LptC [Hydrogenophaga sp.]|uniref:LPS export ABC transporter periplasmic protein LptC n=1 Tax=Hydrogenophaga sp. TaxID=1904254 RepID=UPI002636DDB3|nr:LPS export ABC transporter periplasmic protein LptC [Hydrogenophaga sp.]MDM7943353.1 LPS export ABC transporter periplasmic protein LptC [Hydrogenophaga sp.]